MKPMATKINKSEQAEPAIIYDKQGKIVIVDNSVATQKDYINSIHGTDRFADDFSRIFGAKK